MARFRLHTAAVIDGIHRVAGSIIHKPDDWIGPHRAQVAHSETLDEGAHAHGHDVPLYERLPDEEAEAPAAAEEAEAPKRRGRRAADADAATGAAIIADAGLMGL